MATLREIATRAGVSTCTVSKILSGGRDHERYSAVCREKVQEAARALGFTPNRVASALRTGTTGIIAFAIEWAPGARNGFQAAMIAGCEMAAHRRGLNLLVVGPRAGKSAVAAAVDLVEHRQCDGVIIPGSPDMLNSPSLRKPKDARVAFLGQVPRGFAGGELDDAAGITAAVEHLVGLGHQRLAWVETASNDRAVLRRTAFTRGCTSTGVDGRSLRLPACTTMSDDQAHIIHVRESLLTRRDELDDRSAFVCYHDLTAIGAYAALNAIGRRVPDDVSVVGFDNVHAATTLPALTTIDHELPALAEAAMASLCEGVGVSRVTPRLIVRSSTTAVVNP